MACFIASFKSLENKSRAHFEANFKFKYPMMLRTNPINFWKKILHANWLKSIPLNKEVFDFAVGGIEMTSIFYSYRSVNLQAIHFYLL